MNTLTLQLTPEETNRILTMLSKSERDSRLATEERFRIQGRDQGWSSSKRFRLLLRGSTEKLVKFILAEGREFSNDELAAALGFRKSAHTSAVLGKITGKLRKVGIQAEGHRHTNWYTTLRVGNKTLLNVRPDVMEFFELAMGENNASH
jgi:hypothetical protein